jgi:hypothetical protein
MVDHLFLVCDNTSICTRAALPANELIQDRSIIVTALSVILYAIIVALMFFNVNQGKFRPTTVLYPISWILTNTGAITVLYSRLHLVIDAPRAIKWLAYVLIGIGIPFQVFIVIAAQGNGKGEFILGMKVHNVQWRLECLIGIVEIALAAAYIYFFTVRFVKDGSAGFKGTGKGNQLRWTFILLILGTTFVVVSPVITLCPLWRTTNDKFQAGDIALIAVWLEGYFLVRLAFAPFIYGTKLKVEFLILNCLTGMTQQRAELRNISIPTGNHTNEATLAAAEMAATAILQNAAAAQSVANRDFRAYGISAADWDDVEDLSVGGSEDTQPKGNLTAFSSSVATRSHEHQESVTTVVGEKGSA